MSDIENGNSDKLTDTAREVLANSDVKVGPGTAQKIIEADPVAQAAIDVLSDKEGRDAAAAKAAAEAAAKAAAEAAAKASTPQNLKVAVAAALTERSVGVRETVIGMLAEEQLQKRIHAAMKMIGMLATLEIDLRKARKTEDTFNADGTKREPVFTKEQIDNIKKLDEQRVKYETALQNALDNGNYDKLLELTK